MDYFDVIFSGGSLHFGVKRWIHVFCSVLYGNSTAQSHTLLVRFGRFRARVAIHTVLVLDNNYQVTYIDIF